MKNLKLKNHFLSALVVGFFLFIAFGSDEKQSSDSTTNNTNNETQSEKPIEQNNNDKAITKKETVTQTKSANKNIVNDGTYEGNTTCICCGKYANMPGNNYEIEIKNLPENKVSIYNLEWQQRNIVGQIQDGKIVIDERNTDTNGLTFWGTIDVLDKNTITIDIEWTDTSSPTPEEVLNKCKGTFKNSN